MRKRDIVFAVVGCLIGGLGAGVLASVLHPGPEWAVVFGLIAGGVGTQIALRLA
jgi:hypothetical protein